ncbi:MAG: hypothetical protein ACE5GJ_06335 [Gemmatimonadota bacterium]
MNPPSGSPGPVPDRGAVRLRPGLARGRVLVASFAISAVIHLAVLVIYPRLGRREVVNPVPFVLPITGKAAQGMKAIQLVEVEETEEADRPPNPDLPRDLTGPEVLPGEEAGSELSPEDVLVAPGPTAAERLRPNLRDARLWAPLDPAVTRLTLEQRLELELAGRLEAWRDSVLVAEEAERALTDWTYTDGEGKRWGVSPGKLHLGDVTLPLPFEFGVTPGQRDAAKRRAWEWEEVRRGAITGELRDSWKERAKAIRERRDRERRESRARPDTSGARR